MATTKKTVVVAALMLAMSLTALDATVVSTAMPTVVGSLGGLSLFGWVFSVYLLTSTVTVPLYGKLADLYGRKPVLLAGAVLFLLGSALCGTAQSMAQLIAFRALQGLGAGAVQPITLTIIGDLFSIEQRARIQGFFSSVWGISSVLGPALGGVITDHASWRWVFYLNLPLGLACIGLVSTSYKEQVHRQSHVLDYWGSGLLTGAIAAFLIAILHSGEAYGWTGWQTVGLFTLSVVCLALFLRQERRTPEPVVPLWLFRNRVIVIASLVMFLAGGLMFGVSSYVPLFAQGVLGGTAIDAGLVLAPLSIGWVISSMLSGRIILRAGYYPSGLLGSFFLTTGALLLVTLSEGASQVRVMLAVFVIGLGMGFTSSTFMIAVQNAVAWGQRGIATASNQFFRTIGGSLAVALMGAILNSRMADVQGEGGANILLNPEARAMLAPAALAELRGALAAGLHTIYFVTLAVAVGTVLAVWFFPRGLAHELSHAARRPVVPAVAPAESAALSRPEKSD